MRQELVKQFEGYEAIQAEIDLARQQGEDFSASRGQVAEYINRLHPSRIRVQISKIIDETISTRTIRLTAVDHYFPPFQAGQYITLFLEIDGIKTGRAYSISSPPNHTGYYDITVRRVENGLVSNYLLDDLKIGDQLECSGPQGTFYYNPIIHNDEMICLAGGSGITPFMSMIREITDRGLQRSIHLFYGSKSIDDMIFHKELSAISEQSENIKYTPVVENPTPDYKGKTGFLTKELIEEVSGGAEGKSYFICGPQGMYDFCIPQLEKLGVPTRRIRKEMFGMPDDITKTPGWPPEIKNDDTFDVTVNSSEKISARAGDSLLKTLEKNGLIVPFICRSGECSMCRIKVVSGKVFQAAGATVRKSDRLYGYVHSCASYPLENLNILL